MKYLLLIYNNPAAGPDLDPEARLQGHVTLFKELNETKTVLSSAALGDTGVRTVRTAAHGGAPAVTDGPFLEAKELLAGYYLVDCETPEEAAAIAARIPCGAGGAVEIRPVNEAVTDAVRGDAPYRI
ncbi:YciI family protein [Jiangella rhizosphaerae]|uniref:YciI family protein n=1 Tax=Jiangella rhizosphaerae TaxID=2293569 RepID=A0A418KU01_9ACTN|nr:YciI family protein [Jiangella rhizosphaerae]RIQ31057.1 YciI family protein [Jiangella rhizosphaerae]